MSDAEYAEMRKAVDAKNRKAGQRKLGGKRKPPTYESHVTAGAGFHGKMPTDKVKKREVNLDITFKRAIQMTEWLLDRYEDDMDGLPTHGGVPPIMVTNLKEITASLNTLSLGHARWMKANEELYQTLSDEEKMESLRQWLVALSKQDGPRVREWLRETIIQCKATATADPRIKAGPGTFQVVGLDQEFVGPLPTRPNFKEVAAQVRADFEAKRAAKFGPRPILSGGTDNIAEQKAAKVWSERMLYPVSEGPMPEHFQEIWEPGDPEPPVVNPQAEFAPRERAAYMREYRARKAAEKEADAGDE